SGELLAGARYPSPRQDLLDLEAEVALERAIEAVTLVRAWRDSVGARAGQFVAARLCTDGYSETTPLLARMARLELVADGTADDRGGLAHPAEDGDTGASSGGAPDAGARGLSQESAPVASIPIPAGRVDVLSGEGLDLGAAERRRAASREKLQAE